MGLAAAHGLGQLEHALRRFPFQAPEPLGEQGPHPSVTWFSAKNSAGSMRAVDQIAEIENGVAARGGRTRWPAGYMPA